MDLDEACQTLFPAAVALFMCMRFRTFVPKYSLFVLRFLSMKRESWSLSQHS